MLPDTLAIPNTALIYSMYQAYYTISLEPELSGGAARAAKLCEFIKQWIKSHDLIDQEGYIQALIRHDHFKGFAIEVIFYPKRGVDAYQVRAEFLVTFMDAAKRLGLCLMNG